MLPNYLEMIVPRGTLAMKSAIVGIVKLKISLFVLSIIIVIKLGIPVVLGIIKFKFSSHFERVVACY